ncbi:GatB/YqeY domain-containing protein [Candidatus Entotheonella palauensis]|uniref:Aspartyl-tRNA amidotransferase subunit B n=1 Tax=Candidatus Entotheonella gemina TaxID=1429439 RepID=W4MA71_9BACT|nr:GatB/YqeY domain-containing protein [Candidatus Entotheonella palauensis]ETX07095.1 MAG: aspartyl-tRNA amidotransferase subunit B [Candidatus Entotheonella gemina]
MASALLEQLLGDIKTAMKSKEKDKLSALRFLHAEIKNVEINERRELTDDDVLNVIGRLVKQRQEAMEQFQKGGRDDLVAQESFQLDVYRAYQPEQLSEDEIAELVEQAIAATGAAGKKDMGNVMKAVMPQVKGRAEGKVVNAIVSQKLG